MAGLKRKNAPVHVKGVSKKQKNGPEKANLPKRIDIPLEVETDSDPIVESDTNSQSGDDDGASWPSDEEEEEEDLVSQSSGDSHKLRSSSGAKTHEVKNTEVIADPNRANCKLSPRQGYC